MDTSLLGGCFDVEFAPWSNGLIDDFRRGVFRPVLSDLTAIEVTGAPARVRDLHREVVALGEVMSATEEVVGLLEAYEATAFWAVGTAITCSISRWPPYRAWASS